METRAVRIEHISCFGSASFRSKAISKASNSYTQKTAFLNDEDKNAKCSSGIIVAPRHYSLDDSHIICLMGDDEFTCKSAYLHLTGEVTAGEAGATPRAPASSPALLHL